MKNIGFITNLDRDVNLETTKMLISHLMSLGHNIFIDHILSNILNNPKVGVFSQKTKVSILDFIIVLGGDGTMLVAAELAAHTQTPLLGINLGNIGYLTDTTRQDAISAISKVLNDEYKIEKRMMLESTIGEKQILALNDIIIHRGKSTRLAEYHIFVNNEYMDTYRADGIITSSPTGSTAYNLSAGGPILKPDAKMLVITPICPHTLSCRSVVVSHNDEITIVLNNTQDITISFDSLLINSEVFADKNEIKLHIKSSKYTTNIINTRNLGFFEVLRQKLIKR